MGRTFLEDTATSGLLVETSLDSGSPRTSPHRSGRPIRTHRRAHPPTRRPTALYIAGGIGIIGVLGAVALLSFALSRPDGDPDIVLSGSIEPAASTNSADAEAIQPATKPNDPPEPVNPPEPPPDSTGSQTASATQKTSPKEATPKPEDAPKAEATPKATPSRRPHPSRRPRPRQSPRQKPRPSRQRYAASSCRRFHWDSPSPSTARPPVRRPPPSWSSPSGLTRFALTTDAAFPSRYRPLVTICSPTTRSPTTGASRLDLLQLRWSLQRCGALGSSTVTECVTLWWVQCHPARSRVLPSDADDCGQCAGELPRPRRVVCRHSGRH